MTVFNMDNYIEPFSDYLLSWYLEELNNNDIKTIIQELGDTDKLKNEIRTDRVQEFLKIFNDVNQFHRFLPIFTLYYFKVTCDIDVKIEWFTWRKDADDDYYIQGDADTDIVYEKPFDITINNLENIKSVTLVNLNFDDIYFPADLEIADIWSSKFKQIHFNPSNNLKSLTIWNCPNVTEIIVPEGVTDLPAEAFGGNRNLKRIVLPKSVKAFGKALFLDSNQLEEVEYKGTMKDWENITKEENWNVGYISEVKCSDGVLKVTEW